MFGPRTVVKQVLNTSLLYKRRYARSIDSSLQLASINDR